MPTLTELLLYSPGRSELWVTCACFGAEGVDGFVARTAVVIGKAGGNGVGEDGGSEWSERGAGHGIIFMAVAKAQNGAFGELAFDAGVEAVLIFLLEWNGVLHGIAANHAVDDGVGSVGEGNGQGDEWHNLAVHWHLFYFWTIGDEPCGCGMVLQSRPDYWRNGRNGVRQPMP